MCCIAKSNSTVCCDVAGSLVGGWGRYGCEGRRNTSLARDTGLDIPILELLLQYIPSNIQMSVLSRIPEQLSFRYFQGYIGMRATVP